MLEDNLKLAAIVVVTAMSVFLSIYPDTTPRAIFGYFYGIFYLLFGLACLYGTFSMTTDSLFFFWVAIVMLFNSCLTFYRLLLRPPD